MSGSKLWRVERRYRDNWETGEWCPCEEFENERDADDYAERRNQLMFDHEYRVVEAKP